MDDEAGLRRLWRVGLLALAVGVPLAFLTFGLGVVPGLALVSVAAGRTAGRGEEVPLAWLALAFLVPGLPFAAALVALVGVFQSWGEPLVLFLGAMLLGAVAVAVCTVFLVSFVVEVVRTRRRRRFGPPTPAWENDPTPPSYS